MSWDISKGTYRSPEPIRATGIFYASIFMKFLITIRLSHAMCLHKLTQP